MKLAWSFLYICNTKYPKLGILELEQSRLLRENSSLARGIKQHLNKQQRPRYEFITQWIKSQFLFTGGKSPLIQSPSTKIPEHQVHGGCRKEQRVRPSPALRERVFNRGRHTHWPLKRKLKAWSSHLRTSGLLWRLMNLQRICLHKTFFNSFSKVC